MFDPTPHPRQERTVAERYEHAIKRRAVLQQLVGPFGPRVERMTGNGKDFAVLFGSEASRYQTSASLGGFYHQNAQTQPRNYPIPIWKIFFERRSSERKLRHNRTTRCQNFFDQFSIFFRINGIQPSP